MLLVSDRLLLVIGIDWKKPTLCIHKNNVAVVDIDNLLDIYLDITFVVIT